MNRFSHRVPSAVATYLYSAVITAGLLALRRRRERNSRSRTAAVFQAVARQKIRTRSMPPIRAIRRKPWTPCWRWRPGIGICSTRLVAAWRGTGADLTPVIEPLADAAMAAAMVDYAWRRSPQTALTLANAPLLGQLMARYPDSGRTFLSDLLGPTSSGQPSPDLSPAETEAVCRFLLDMPDVGTWHKSALRILPRYRRVVEGLLDQDIHGADREKGYRARMWMSELESTSLPSRTSSQPGGGKWARRRRRLPADRIRLRRRRLPAPSSTVNGRPTLARAMPGPPEPLPRETRARRPRP